MKDTINRSRILNRKLIVEIRYKPNPTVIDLKGSITQAITSASLIAEPQWELGMRELKVSEEPGKSEQSRKFVYADIQRLTVMSAKDETNASFYQFFEKAYRAFRSVVKDLEILRIGCRIQGTYSSGFDSFEKNVQNFTDMFPAKFLLEDFPTKDLMFTHVYQNGQYNIGPVTKDDSFLRSEFQFEDVNTNPGIVIDTDNYVIKSKEKPALNDSMVRDVYTASLSVEKLLFDKLSMLKSEQEETKAAA